MDKNAKHILWFLLALLVLIVIGGIFSLTSKGGPYQHTYQSARR